MTTPRIMLAAVFGLVLQAACASTGASCQAGAGVSLQVLGSGGPIADDALASTAYLIWVDGRSRVLVDFGGGAFLRFGEAGARFEDLDFIAISHFHTDHVADLVTLLKTGYFSSRRRDLRISGPGRRGRFPGLDEYLERQIGKDGAYGYLSGYLDGSGGLVRLDPLTLDADSRESLPVTGDDRSAVQIEAHGVPHGIVPALAYRVRIGDAVIVFAGDQNGNDAAFVDFARAADVLVMHMAVPEGVTGGGRRLHAPPGRIGRIAADAQPRLLVISHFMARSLRDIDANLGLVRQQFAGRTLRATDLACIGVGSHAG